MSNEPLDALDDPTSIALIATVNALIKHLRLTDAAAVDQVLEDAQKEVRARTDSSSQIRTHALNALRPYFFAHED